MSNSVPVYVARIESDDLAHIVVGKELDTLCGSKKVIDAMQVASDTSPLQALNDKEQYCSECKEKWKEIQYDIVREQTVHCFICENSVSGCLSRSTEHMDKGSASVCKVCYKKLYNSESSNVTIPYDEAEPAYPMHGERTYNPD